MYIYNTVHAVEQLLTTPAADQPVASWWSIKALQLAHDRAFSNLVFHVLKNAYALLQL